MVFPFKRVAESLLTLRDQINAMAPNRSKASDGTVGDEAHLGRKSDHNPNADGVVTAMDITNDPVHGVDAGQIAESLRLSQDPRIKYVISNRRIFSSSISPWQWRTYDGVNAHTKHVHISVVANPKLYDNTDPWAIDALAKVHQPLRAPSSKRCTGITATVFGGSTDHETSAYDGHVITDTEMGVALPARFKGPRPKVRVINPEIPASVDCDIVDVGPWNIDDPYWEMDQRPEAESGTDRRGRHTNLAGIDLTPAAARAIGIKGKGQVDWEFVEASPVTVGGSNMATNANDLASILQQVVAVLEALNKPQAGQPAPAPAPASQAAQIQKILSIVTELLGASAPVLGQVNGAPGQTIGNLLNGKKTAIGTIGAILTAVLGNLPTISGALAQIFGIASTTPVAPIAMPIFLGLALWGVLGKFEKWSQGVALPTSPAPATVSAPTTASMPPGLSMSPGLQY